MDKIPRVSQAIPTRVKTQRIITAKYAKDNNLDILTPKEYASRFYLTEAGAMYRVRKRQVQAFKSKGRWFIVIPKESKTGLEYAY